MKKFIFMLLGFLSGFVNGLIGSAGGMIAVETLQSKTDVKKAHATSVAVILPMCLVSIAIYVSKGEVRFEDALPFLLWGIVGAAIGTIILLKLNTYFIRKIFAILLFWAAYRLFTR